STTSSASTAKASGAGRSWPTRQSGGGRSTWPSWSTRPARKAAIVAEFGKLLLEGPEGQAQEFLLSKPNVTLGRATTNYVVLSDPKASRFHARVDCTADECTLVDLGSANGTTVGGARVERARLRHGDVIQI